MPGAFFTSNCVMLQQWCYAVALGSGAAAARATSSAGVISARVRRRRAVSGIQASTRDGIGTATERIPARLAAVTPWAESSKTRQSAGCAATLAATVRKISGDGLTALTSLDVTMVAKC